MTQTSTDGAAAPPSKLAADPLRPSYHFLPPANWMNDPNGPIFHNGWYHLFYQYNPYADAWGSCHWGHARSRDLVHWEHLPIALAPLHSAGEEHCFSGCAAIDDQGRPVLLYTSVPFSEHAQECLYAQWAAIGDDDLLTWQRHPDNPILALDAYGGPQVEPDWRDPFIFTEAGRTFLVLGANTADRANILLFEARDGTLLHWRYCGVLYSQSRETSLLECPNFFKVDGKWVLLISPFRPIEWMVGSFDVPALTFQPEREGVLDFGCSDVPNFYASNILYDAQGRCILLGWVRGFAPGRGWNGCLAAPRVLTVDADNTLRQAFLPELQQLRGRATTASLRGRGGDWRVDGVFPPRLEAEIAVTCDDADAVAVRFVSAEDHTTVAEIHYTGSTLTVQDTAVPFTLAAGEALQLHILLDGMVLEVLAGGGRTSITRLLADAPALEVELAVEGGQVHIDRCTVWELAAIA